MCVCACWCCLRDELKIYIYIYNKTDTQISWAQMGRNNWMAASNRTKKPGNIIFHCEMQHTYNYGGTYIAHWILLADLTSCNQTATILFSDNIKINNQSNKLRPMAHDPSSPPKFLVPETGTSNFASVPCIQVTDFSGTRNLGIVGQCSIHHQKIGCTWLKCSTAIGRRDLHAHDKLYTQSIVCK